MGSEPELIIERLLQHLGEALEQRKAAIAIRLARYAYLTAKRDFDNYTRRGK
jgi:hypothetical protein